MLTFLPRSCLLSHLSLGLCVCDCDDLTLTSVSPLHPKVGVYRRIFRVSLINLERFPFFSPAVALCFTLVWFLSMNRCCTWSNAFPEYVEIISLLFYTNVYTLLDLSIHWPLLKTVPYRAIKCSEICVWEEGGKILLSSSSSSFWCPLCLGLFVSCYQQLNSGSENCDLSSLPSLGSLTPLFSWTLTGVAYPSEFWLQHLDDFLSGWCILHCAALIRKCPLAPIAAPSPSRVVWWCYW